MGTYKILSEFAEENESFANIQYQRNARQSANMQERDRGQSIQQMGFMNVEQRMATPLPKYADCGQDMTSYEIHRLEQLLLEFGQREAPSPQVPVTRPPLTRKRSQSYIEGVADADKRPRLQWRKKEERDQSGRIASWVDDRTPPPGVPRPPAPVTGTHTSSVYRPPHPRGQEAASPKEDFPKRNVSADQSIAGKGKGQGSSFTKGTNAPVKGAPRGSVGRAMSSRPEDSMPRRGNILKDLLGPPLHTPPPVPLAKPQIPKPPSMPPPVPVKAAPTQPPAKPSPPKVPPPKVPPPKVPPPDISSTTSGIPANTRPPDFNLTPKPPPLTDLYNRLQPSVKGKQQASQRGGPYGSLRWNVHNVPPPPLPSGVPPTAASSSNAPIITGQPTMRGTDDRPLEPFDFPGVQCQRTDPWADNYWPNHMELRQWLQQGWHDETERFGYRRY